MVINCSPNSWPRSRTGKQTHKKSDPALELMAPLVFPNQYQSFTLVTLKTTGRDGNCIKSKDSVLRMPTWHCFLDRVKEKEPYVRQYNGQWEERKSTHVQTHRSDMRTGLSGWPLWQIKWQEWHRVCVCKNVSRVCACVNVFVSSLFVCIWKCFYDNMYTYALFIVHTHAHCVDMLRLSITFCPFCKWHVGLSSSILSSWAPSTYSLGWQEPYVPSKLTKLTHTSVFVCLSAYCSVSDCPSVFLPFLTLFVCHL